MALLTPDRGRQELQTIAEDLRAAVLAQDVETLLKYAWRNTDLTEPLTPEGGRFFNVFEVARDKFRGPNGYLYCLFFDTACLQAGDEELRRRYPTPPDPHSRISIRDFLLRGPQPEARVIFCPNTIPEDQWIPSMLFPTEHAFGLGMILYVLPGAREHVAEDPFKTWYQYWGETYVGLELWATRSHGWKYVNRMFFDVGCRARHIC